MKAGEEKPQLFHRTFQMPKRRDDLLDGGSLYWVIKGVMQVRQPLLDIAEGTKADGTPCCLLILKNELVPVRPTPGDAFQGWRYLDLGGARDLKGRLGQQHRRMPPEAAASSWPSRRVALDRRVDVDPVHIAPCLGRWPQLAPTLEVRLLHPALCRRGLISCTSDRRFGGSDA